MQTSEEMRRPWSFDRVSAAVLFMGSLDGLSKREREREREKERECQQPVLQDMPL